MQKHFAVTTFSALGFALGVAAVMTPEVRGQCTEWETIIPGGDSGLAYAAVQYENQLIVGGSFDEIGGIEDRGIAAWDGQQWHSLGGGIYNTAEMFHNVSALHVYEGDLYASGSFTVAGNVPANRVARWDGEQWHPVGVGVWRFPVNAMIEFEGDLIAGGGFQELGSGEVVNNIARWDGEQWHAMGAGIAHTNDNPDTVEALAVHEDQLIAAGQFSEDWDGPANYVAVWDGQAWKPLDSGGPNGAIRSMALYQGDLYVGGEFTAVGSTTASNVARWDGQQWHAVGSFGIAGTDGRVDSMLVHDGELLVSGDFTEAGNFAVDGMARWDGQFFLPFGDGVNWENADVYGIGTYNGEVVVTGRSGSPGNSFLKIERWRTGKPAIFQQPQDVLAIIGDTAEFSVAAEHDKTTTYQWRRNGQPLSNGGNISGANTSTVLISNVTKADVGAFDLLITNSCGESTSFAAALSVEVAPQPTCDADLNGDGVVDVSDLLQLLGQWGVCLE